MKDPRSCTRAGRAVAGRPRFSALAALLVSIPLLGATPVRAKVFLARQEALQTAFPDATRVEASDVFLEDRQLSAVEAATGERPESAMLTVYRGYRDGSLLGYAFFDTHNVRTKPETFLFVLSPSGEVSRLFLCAFYEPPEYAPSNRWLDGFVGMTGPEQTVVGRKVAGITGSTLTSHAVSAGLRRALAFYRICIEPRTPGD